MIKDRLFSISDEELLTVYTVDDYLDQITNGCQRTFEIDPTFTDLQVDS